MFFRTLECNLVALSLPTQNVKFGALILLVALEYQAAAIHHGHDSRRSDDVKTTRN